MDYRDNQKLRKITDDLTMLDVRHFYIHIPFCRRKCRYCAFYSLEYNSAMSAQFIDSLKQEIYRTSKNYSGGSVYENSTIFFGGGTPSILDTKTIEEIISLIRSEFDIENFSEATLECNPESVSKNKFEQLRNAGINRISIGVQSLDDVILNFLGRIHNSEQALDAVDAAIDAGFENISTDFIFGIPGQTQQQIIGDIDKIIVRNVKHISFYSLTVEKGTPLAKSVATGEIIMPSSDEIAEQYYSATELLSNAGFVNYEVSNFSLPGYECQHNLAYWNGGNYLGFGPAAHSFYDNRRWHNVKSVGEYIARLQMGKTPMDFSEILSSAERFEEYIMLRLRLADGFSVKTAAEILSIDVEILWSVLKKFIESEKMFKKGDVVALNTENRLLADGIAAKIVEEVFDEIE